MLVGGTLLAASLILTACGDDDDDTTTPTGSSSAGSSSTVSSEVADAQAAAAQYVQPPTTITQDTPLSGAVPTGKKIIFVNSGIPATQIIADGSQEAAEAIGWSFESVSYDPANPATVQAALQTALTKGADVVIIAGTAPTSYGDSVIAAYKAAGVPIVVGSVCPLTVEDPIIAGSNGCDGEEMVGRALANWFIADSNGEGKVLFSNVKAIPALAAFVNAFSDEVSTKCPDCTVDVLEATLAQVGDNTLVPSLVNKLRSDPSYGYLFFDNAQWAKGIGSALSAAGLKDIKVGGRSADDTALAELAKGTQVAWTATPYNVAGYGNIDAAIRALLGSTDGADGNVVPPFQLVTPDNVSAVSAPYKYPADALDQYLKLWNVTS